MRSASQGASLPPIPYDPFDLGPLPEVHEIWGRYVLDVFFPDREPEPQQ